MEGERIACNYGRRGKRKRKERCSGEDKL